MKEPNPLQIGQKVKICIPGNYNRYGVVVDTDYHPFGIEDAVKVEFQGEPGGNTVQWVASKYVRKVEE